MAMISAPEPSVTFVKLRSGARPLSYTYIERERERVLGNDFSATALGDLGQFEEWCAADEIRDAIRDLRVLKVVPGRRRNMWGNVSNAVVW